MEAPYKEILKRIEHIKNNINKKVIPITLAILVMTFLFTGCNQPKEVEKSELAHYIQELMALNTSYKNKEINAMTYLKKSRVINEKIHKQEEGLDTHDHMH